MMSDLANERLYYADTDSWHPSSEEVKNGFSFCRRALHRDLARSSSKDCLHSVQICSVNNAPEMRFFLKRLNSADIISDLHFFDRTYYFCRSF